MNLPSITDALVQELAAIRFRPPVAYVYNPLEYARTPHDLYLERFGAKRKRDAVLVGMNPGPWGMVQTGVPFGDVAMVRDWMGIEAAVGKPPRLHPKRPVDGFACTRREVSGTRLWSFARDRFKTPRRFFSRFYVANYCPLAFFDESGANRTPDRLPLGEREAIISACDRALQRTVAWLQPRYVIGIGVFAETQARRALADADVTVGRILHPSPASPLANRGWAPQAAAQLASYGIRVDS